MRSTPARPSGSPRREAPARRGATTGPDGPRVRAARAREHVACVELSTPFGPAVLVAGEAGVNALWLGDDPSSLVAGLRERWPALGDLGDGGSPVVCAHVAAARAALDDPARLERVRLDPRETTAFQARVYAALRALGPGQTISYGGLARVLGLAGGARAVGAACAANQVALLNPCHRAIRADGELGGYRWGLERKRAILEAERQAAEAAAGVRPGPPPAG